jgi:hypothetical protein
MLFPGHKIIKDGSDGIRESVVLQRCQPAPPLLKMLPYLYADGENISNEVVLARGFIRTSYGIEPVLQPR